MKNKILISIFSTLVFLLVLNFGANIYLNKIITKQLSESLNEEITIKTTSLNIFNNSLILKDVQFSKKEILVKNIEIKISIKDFLKDKNNFNIDSLNFKNISFINKINFKNSESNNNIVSESKNDKAEQFFDEIDKQIKGSKGLTTFFKSKFNNENFTKNSSENLTDFLIKNVDFVDIIIQNEINAILKSDIESFSKSSKELLSNLRVSKNNEREIYIKSIIFNGNIDNILFKGEFKNINTNLSKNISIPLNLSLNEKNGSGNGKIYGDFNMNTFNANIYIKLFNFNVISFKNINKYLSNGVLDSEQLLSINGNNIVIDGTTNLNNIIFDRETIEKSKKLDKFKKIIFNKIIDLVETSDSDLSVFSNFSTKNKIITVKTTIPNTLKKELSSNRLTFSSFLENELKGEYKNNLEEGKNKLKNFFKNIF
ncbi:MAG: hypothetical protein ACRCZR_03120 [Cetobacterium sp.]